MEVGVLASARGENEGILLSHLRSGHRAERGLHIVGQRVLSKRLERVGVELEAPRHRVEARVAIRAQVPGLVLAVAHDALVRDLLA